MMTVNRCFFITILSLSLLPWVGGVWAQGAQVIVNVNIVPMNSERILRDKTVIIRGERIEAIINSCDYQKKKDDHLIDAGGAYLLPGLADMHIHLRSDPDATFRLFLANGVTTIRNMDWLDGGFDHATLRDEIEAGTRLGPRYLVSGPVLNPGTLPDVEAVGPMLAKHVDRKLEYVKVHMDLKPEVYEALLTEARELGLTVVGHAQRNRPLEQTLRLYSIAHAEEFLYVLGRPLLSDDARRRAAARQVAESGVYVSPTLTIYDSILDYLVEERFEALPNRPQLQYLSSSERDEWLSPTENYYRKRGFNDETIERLKTGSDLLAVFTRDLHEAGVPLILGSDAFGVVVPGFSIHDELARLVEIGLSPYEALRTGTTNVADYLHESGEAGRVAEGYRADLVLVGDNPLVNIAATRDVRGVFVRGRWISAEELEAMLADIRLAAGASASIASAEKILPVKDLTSDQWRSDLEFVEKKIREIHPKPFGRVDEAAFEATVRSLHRDIPGLEGRQIVARMMELTGLVQDGHTSIQPTGEHGFRRWFPLRFHVFSDGLFITVVDRQWEQLLGGEVLRVGGLSATEALERVQRLVAADNEMWKLANGPLYLSNGDALAALGVIESPETLPLVVRTRTGAEVSVTLSSTAADFSTSWFWRVLGVPPGASPVRPWDDDFPLHLRDQLPLASVYSFQYLPEDRILYFQLNGWWNGQGETFLQFTERFWKAYDEHRVDHLVWDLRYNAGGDGSMFKEFFLEILRRPELQEPGRLVVLTGRRTFSASANAIGDLLKLVNITLIGEPMGSGLNLYGDNASFRLPESGLTLKVSTLFWQNGFPYDTRTVLSPHVPATFSSSDFFSGRDPAIELVRSGEALGLVDRMRSYKMEAAMKWFREQKVKYSDLGWWVPFGERELNHLGYQLLSGARFADSQAAFELNSETFPESWNVWDSLGEAYLKAGNNEKAATSYQKSLALNPGNQNARQLLEQLGQRAED